MSTRIDKLNQQIREVLPIRYTIHNKINRVIDVVYFSDEYGLFQMRGDRILRKCKITSRSLKDYDAYLRSYIHKNYPDFHILDGQIANRCTDYIIVEYKGLRYRVQVSKLLQPNFNLSSSYSDCLDRDLERKERLLVIWGDALDFSKTDFTAPDNHKHKVIATCRRHGDFQIRIGQLLSGHGCKKCANEKQAKHKRLSLESYIERANRVHDSQYDYSLIRTYHRDDKIPIICRTHGVFYRNNRAHLQGAGCPLCRGKIIDTLYLLYDDCVGLYKIGISKGHPNARIKRFQEGCKLPQSRRRVIIIKTWGGNTYLYEKKIHKYFARYQLDHPYYHSGASEWFEIPYMPDKIINIIDELISRNENY